MTYKDIIEILERINNKLMMVPHENMHNGDIIATKSLKYMNKLYVKIDNEYSLDNKRLLLNNVSIIINELHKVSSCSVKSVEHQISHIVCIYIMQLIEMLKNKQIDNFFKVY